MIGLLSRSFLASRTPAWRDQFVRAGSMPVTGIANAGSALSLASSPLSCDAVEAGFLNQFIVRPPLGLCEELCQSPTKLVKSCSTRGCATFSARAARAGFAGPSRFPVTLRVSTTKAKGTAMTDGMLARQARERKDEWSFRAGRWADCCRRRSSGRVAGDAAGRPGLPRVRVGSAGRSAGRRGDGRLEVLSELDAEFDAPDRALGIAGRAGGGGRATG